MQHEENNSSRLVYANQKIQIQIFPNQEIRGTVNDNASYPRNKTSNITHAKRYKNKKRNERDRIHPAM